MSNQTSILLLLFFLAVRVVAQTPGRDTFTLVQQLKVEARGAAADQFGNVYVLTSANALEKYAPDGRLLTRYTNNRLGQAARMDVSNPLKIMLWYPDFRTAVFLDRSLTPLGELNLIAAGIPEVRSLALAQDGNLWLYDEIQFKLKKVTPEGALRFESQPLNLLLPGERFQVRCIRENDNLVYASDSEHGILVFDLYAQWIRQHPLLKQGDFDVRAGRLIYLDDKLWHSRQLQLLEEVTVPLPGGGDPVGFGGAEVLLQRAGWLLVYRLL